MTRHRHFMLLTLLTLSSVNLAEAEPKNTVRITPLGSHPGEFCSRDRALILEDPNGTRILYDAGRTVAGADDSRLGKIDIVLVSHVHGDHMGNQHIAKTGAGSCAQPETPINDAPLSNSVKIAVAKQALMITGSEMARMFAARMKAAGGRPEDSQLVRFGAMKHVKGIGITTVPAVHSNGLGAEFIGGELGESMHQAGLTAYVGPPTGYVIKFSNGLVVYLSGDTGITAEQQMVVGKHYAAKLTVMNIGDTYTTGPTEAAYVINQMIKPNAVIASHANEAATRNGKVLEGTRTRAFIDATHVPVYLPLSDRTMSFSSTGHCVEGCK